MKKMKAYLCTVDAFFENVNVYSTYLHMYMYMYLIFVVNVCACECVFCAIADMCVGVCG